MSVLHMHYEKPIVSIGDPGSITLISPSNSNVICLVCSSFLLMEGKTRWLTYSSLVGGTSISRSFAKVQTTDLIVSEFI